jgi:hypothetical protein
MLLSGRTVSYPWETIEAMEEESPRWQQYIAALLPRERGPVLCLRTHSQTLRFGCFLERWADFVAQVRAGQQTAGPAPAVQSPTAEAVARAFGATTEDLPLVFRFGRQRPERWLLPVGVVTVLACFMMILLMLVSNLPTPPGFLLLLMSLLMIEGIAVYRLLRYHREWVEVEVSVEGITLTDWRKRARTYRWEDMLDVGEVRHWLLRYLWIRTPWSVLHLWALREHDRLREGLRRLLDARQQPPQYPVGVPVAPDTALSRAAPPTAPQPTAASLSRSETEVPVHLAEAVEQETEGLLAEELQTVNTRSGY